MTQDLVELAVRALHDTLSEKSTDASGDLDVLKGMVEEATKSLRGGMDIKVDELDAMLQAIAAQPSYSAGFEYSRRQVSRWFEIPLDEFDQVDMASLRPEILFQHLSYERKLYDWFTEWGYQVTVGEELEGMAGADFIPDVYADLQTLHGNFQIAVTLFCSNPPNTWRVLGMLENLEAFAPKGSEFGERDMYMMITPFKFLEQASTHIRLQEAQEDYYVLAIEGNELQDLENAQDSVSRKERLQDMVAAVARAKNAEAF